MGERPRTPEDIQERVLNVAFGEKTSAGRILSNFADTPFTLHGRQYATVESFWQGLYFPHQSVERDRIAQMSGRDAKREAEKKPPGEQIEYNDTTIVIGSSEHHLLMRQALEAKFRQNPNVLAELINTGDKIITHVVRKKDGAIEPDSKSIPRRIFSRMLMDLRTELKQTLNEE